MLLLILFAGCLATSAAQTMLVPGSTPGNMTTAGVYQTMADPREYVAVLQAAVQSNIKLNNTTAAPILEKFRELIVQKLQLDPGISLTIRNITEV